MKAVISRRKLARSLLYQGYGPAWTWFYCISLDGGVARDHALSSSLVTTRAVCLCAADKMAAGGSAFPIFGLGCESVTEDWSGRVFIAGPRGGVVEQRRSA